LEPGLVLNLLQVKPYHVPYKEPNVNAGVANNNSWPKEEEKQEVHELVCATGPVLL